MSDRTIRIKPVETKAELKKFVRFNYELYKDNPYAVPDLLEDGLETFDPRKNAAYRFCEAQTYLAYQDGRVVGRVAAIINHKANERWKTKNVRFGWIDFADDREVSKALIGTVAQWGKERGMTHIVGPLGFTDMDSEGMLFEGFDNPSTMTTIYNYPYYPQHIEAMGFEKEAVWWEYLLKVPDPNGPHKEEKYFRVAKLVEQRYNLKVRKFKSLSELKKAGYISEFFNIINLSYANLYGFSELTKSQQDAYADNYLRFIDLNLLTFVETAEGKPVAAALTMPSLSLALRKARGRLVPFGWLHLLLALKTKRFRSEYIDMMLIGVLPEYQDKGIPAMIFADLIPRAQAMGFKWAEGHPQLETNEKGRSIFDYIESKIHNRRAVYKKSI